VPLGVVRTFQNIRLYGGLSVLENVLIGQHSRAHTGLLSLLPFRTASDRRLREEAREALDLFELTPYRRRRAAELPYGLQKQLEMARALAARPTVLLATAPAGRCVRTERARIRGREPAGPGRLGARPLADLGRRRTGADRRVIPRPGPLG
jgi:branched-chain amino acid transport system ATP-binding protein